jgi:hypothetical protein
MKKQTAVEWLIEQIESDKCKTAEDSKKIFEQAEQMEKEESKSKLVDELIGFQIFLKDMGFITDFDWGWEDAAKQYYNETYTNGK